MVSLKRLLRFGRKSKCERKVNLSLLDFWLFLIKTFQIYCTFYVSTFKDRIHEHLDINFFTDKESDKMSAESVPVQRTSGVNQQIHLH